MSRTRVESQVEDQRQRPETPHSKVGGALGGGGFLLCYTPAKDEEIMNSPDAIQDANGTRKVRNPGLVMCLFLLVSPAWGQTKVKPGFNLFSVEQDVEIGKQSAAEVEKQLPVLKDSMVQNYVARLGDRLARVVQGAEYPYQFKVINVSDVNAFALPGGFMYLNRGLIQTAKSESELAGVMAHELSHVAIRHGTNQASKAYLAQAGLGVLGGILGGGSGSTGQIIGAVGGFGLNTVFLKFGRKAEQQADVVGAQTLAKAGYDPLAMADFFETLRELSGGDPSRFETFFSSHPAPGNRARRIEEEVELLGAIRKTPPVGSFSRIKAHLDRLPDAPSMQELAEKGAGSAPDSGSSEDPPGPAPTRIEAPSTRLQLFRQRDGFFRIRYPSNWSSYESQGDWETTLAPRGGVREGAGGESQIVYGLLVGHFDPSAGDQGGQTSGPFRESGELERSGNLLINSLIAGNDYLRPVRRSTREQLVDGEPALSVKLSGRSPASGETERVVVVLRRLPNHELVYLAFVAPEKRFPEIPQIFQPVLSSFGVNDRVFSR